jgi:hypothetical protein
MCDMGKHLHLTIKPSHIKIINIFGTGNQSAERGVRNNHQTGKNPIRNNYMRTKNELLSILLILFSFTTLYAQRTQTIEGKVIDKESKSPVIGVSVRLPDAKLGAVTDTDGYYKITDVPIGKHMVVFSYLGYLNVNIPDVLVTSAKEVVLPIEMEESASEIKDVTIEAKRDHANEMALVSVKTFDVQEVDRYAGSRSDIPRMASNFAGVQGGDDSRNDIIIRGNSPQGVIWRLEDIDIPNPNHFNIPGTTGGPVTILNNKTLANSEFYTGAFPSQYGNGVAGVFDVHLRNGNPDQYEFTGQLGFLGTELAAEGPISKKDGSSFLVTYRYSTLQLFQSLNINIGSSSTPHYQDAAFKLNFPIGKKCDITFFGVGGLSNIDLIVSNLTSFKGQEYGESDRDQYFTSNTGVVGTSFSYTINPGTYTKIVIAESGNDIIANHKYVIRDSNFVKLAFKDILGYDYKTSSTSVHWFLNKKYSARHILQVGLIGDLYHIDYIDSSRQYPVTRQDWQYRNNFVGNTDLLQAYVQYKYRPSDNVSVTIGLHGQYLTHSGSKAIEPRAAVKWIVNNSNTLSLGYGLHSEALPFYQYFSFVPAASKPNPGFDSMQNYKIDFIRSHHIVAGYDHNFSNILHLKFETYYQYLYNIPVETAAGSSFTALDQGSDYSRNFPGKLKNTGTGYNYGAEVTLTKAFTDGYYFMFTGSVFDSKAAGNDGIYRNTDYNSHYAFNLLGGYERKLGQNSTLITGIKFTYAGGKLYSPADVAASNAAGYYLPIETERNTLEFKPYFRTDVKLGIRINGKKVTHEIAVDLVNITNNRNILSSSYSTILASQGKDPFYYQTQLGFLPLFYYRIDFSIGKKG